MKEIEIDCQSATRDINNVYGNQYIFNKPVFKLIGHAGALDKVELQIKELDRVDYLNQLRKQLSEKKLISRKTIVEDICNLLDDHSQIIIYGDPGAGKTVILNEIAGAEAVYLSIKGKSVDRVLRHLVKSFGVPYDDCDRDGIIDLIEGFLQHTSNFFLIDHCDNNQEIINTLVSIEKFDNKFIFSSRNRNIAGSFQIVDYQVLTFNEGEIMEFLEINQIDVDDLRLSDLITASQGNPLYLYYFANHQIKPLPAGLIEYESAIWRSLSAREREILSFVSVSVFPITLNVLRDSYISITQETCSPMMFTEMLSGIDFLLKRNESMNEIFHLSFRDFMLDELMAMGLVDSYRKIIGNACFAHNEIVHATILLLDIENEKIKPYIFGSAHSLYNIGYIDYAQRLLLCALKTYDAKHELYELGYAHYHLSNIYKDFSDFSNAYYHIDEAQKIFEIIDEEELLLAVLAFKAVYLAEEGKKKESLEIVNNIINSLQDDQLQQALAFVNITKIYIYFNQYKVGAEYGKKALEIFIELKDINGIQISILNYSACLANIEEEELATKYLEDLLESKNFSISQHVKAAILNNLTSCYRKSGDYEKAKQYCIESIRIVRKLGLNDKVAMNLLNLGNVYRDVKDYKRCEAIYRQGLKIAEDCNCTKEVGRAFELIANIYNAQDKYLEAKEAAINSIKASSLVRDDFRIAESYIEKANANKKLGLIKEYVDDLNNAIIHYLNENFSDKAIFYLFEMTNIAKKNELKSSVDESIRLIKEVIDNFEQIDILGLIDNLKESSETVDNINAIEIMEKILRKYILDENNLNIAYPFIYFVTLCKKELDKGGKDRYCMLLNSIEAEISNNNKLMILLAVLIEQSNYLLEFKEVEKIIEDLVKSIDGLYYREKSDGTGIFTICWEKNVIIQILSTRQDITEFKIALSMSLILKAREEYIVSRIKNFNEDSLEIYVLNHDTFVSEIQEISDELFFEPVSAVFGERVGYDIAVPIILCKNYMERSDFVTSEDNKAFVWILMNLYRVLISHFSHLSIEEFGRTNVKEASQFVKSIMLQIDNKEREDFWKVEFNINSVNPVFSEIKKRQ